MNIRQAITRNITYSKVTVTFGTDIREHLIYGITTPLKELKKWISANGTESNIIPTFEVETLTEKRAITIDDFIAHSKLITIEEIKDELNTEFGYTDTDTNTKLNNESEEN